MSKEALDRIFQQGAERYDFEYNPAAWQAMEHLLAEQRRRRWVLWCFWGGFGIVLLIMGIWLFLVSSGKGASAVSPTPAAPAEQPPPPPSDNVLPLPEKKAVPPAQRPVSPAGRPNDRQKPVADRNSSQKTITAPDLAQPSTPLQTDLATQQPAARELLPAPPEGQQSGRETTPTDILRMRPLPYLPGKVETLTYTRTEIIRDTTGPLLVDPVPSMVEEKSRLILSAQAAPNYSSVGIRGPLESGRSFGIGAAYLIGARQTIGIGIELSKKEYLATGGDYTPPYGFWTRRITPTETFGSCTILEIPIQFTQYLGPLHRPGGYLQAGLASYLMLRESYYYHYEQSDPDLIRWWETRNDNQHWLSVVNFAGGFRYPLSSKYALSLGPFVNIPLGGVGHGQVKLYSLGISLGVDVLP